MVCCISYPSCPLWVTSTLPRSTRVNDKTQQGFQIELQRDAKTPWGFQLDPVALEEGSARGGEVRSMMMIFIMIYSRWCP